VQVGLVASDPEEIPLVPDIRNSKAVEKAEDLALVVQCERGLIEETRLHPLEVIDAAGGLAIE
jgi:hypothetical protein